MGHCKSVIALAKAHTLNRWQELPRAQLIDRVIWKSGPMKDNDVRIVFSQINNLWSGRGLP